MVRVDRVAVGEANFDAHFPKLGCIWMRQVPELAVIALNARLAEELGVLWSGGESPIPGIKGIDVWDYDSGCQFWSLPYTLYRRSTRRCRTAVRIA